MTLSSSPLALIQARLVTVTAGIGRVPADQSWSALQEVLDSGLGTATVRPFLSGFGMPQFAGLPNADDLRAIANSLRRCLEPGPIRRKDPIAQNSFHWAGRAAVRQGRKKVTYKTLDARADVIGTFLAACIRDRGQRVAAFFGHNRSNLFEIVLGCRRAGVAFTNFHSYLSGEQFLEKVEQCDYQVLFVDSGCLVKLEPYLPLLEARGRVVVDIDSQHPSALSYGSLIADGPRPAAQTPDQKPPRYPGPIMWSSGTTGRPKLISVIANSKAGASANKIFRIRETDKNLVVGQLYHGGAYSWAKGHLNRGAEVVLTAHSALTLNPEEVFKEIQGRGITNFWISPTWLQGLCDFLESESKQQKYDLSSLRAIYVGASHFHPALKRQGARNFGPILWENYATTEFGLVTLLRPDELLDHANTSGRAAPGIEIEIRDDEGNKVPTGTAGTIYVRNSAQDGEFHEGDDFGVLDEEGFLSILGRTIERIVYGGMTVYPRPVESAIMEMPGVQECHVIGLPNPAEPAEPRVVAAVVPKKKSRLSAGDIRDFLSTGEAARHLNGVPVSAVLVPSLPRKPYKVNRPILSEMLSRLLNGVVAEDRGLG